MLRRARLLRRSAGAGTVYRDLKRGRGKAAVAIGSRVVELIVSQTTTEADRRRIRIVGIEPRSMSIGASQRVHLAPVDAITILQAFDVVLIGLRRRSFKTLTLFEEGTRRN